MRRQITTGENDRRYCGKENILYLFPELINLITANAAGLHFSMSLISNGNMGCICRLLSDDLHKAQIFAIRTKMKIALVTFP
jgi:hypothetical protein